MKLNIVISLIDEDTGKTLVQREAYSFDSAGENLGKLESFWKRKKEKYMDERENEGQKWGEEKIKDEE